MTPAARLQAAIEILGALENTNQAADRFLRDWFRARRYAGAKDRAAIGERVFAVLRHRASLGWRLHSDQPRALVLASLMKDGLDESAIDDLFNGGGYGPAPLDAAERAAIAWDPREPPAWVQGDFPEFLEAELTRSLGDNWRDEMCVLNGRATIDLRVNTLKGARDAVLRELGDQGFAVEPTPYALYGIRLVEREKGSQLHSTRAFLDGRFEFQDEAAQIAAMLCAAKPG
jgi:16S rRNA (cytosine967-C5)-methyltransferase